MLFWRWKIQEILKGISCSTQHQQGGLRLFVGKPRHRWLNRGERGTVSGRSLFFAFFYTENTFGLTMGCIETRQGTGSGVSVKTMNVLAIIKARKEKSQLRKEAQKAFLVYRGVPYTKTM